jgi:hypothetical protein
MAGSGLRDGEATRAVWVGAAAKASGGCADTTSRDDIARVADPVHHARG